MTRSVECAIVTVAAAIHALVCHKGVCVCSNNVIGVLSSLLLLELSGSVIVLKVVGCDGFTKGDFLWVSNAFSKRGREECCLISYSKLIFWSIRQ